jgi:serine/threonine protein kinase
LYGAGSFGRFIFLVTSLNVLVGGWEFNFCQVWEYFEQVASGLSHIHKHGVLHLDIKPENIFIDGQGTNSLFTTCRAWPVCASETDLALNAVCDYLSTSHLLWVTKQKVSVFGHIHIIAGHSLALVFSFTVIYADMVLISCIFDS